jgi:hypothetical protein
MDTSSVPLSAPIACMPRITVSMREPEAKLAQDHEFRALRMSSNANLASGKATPEARSVGATY